MSSTRLTKKDISWVLKDNYIQVTIKGHPFSLDGSHPTFSKMKNAIKKKSWSKIPKLVSIARAIHDETHGDVEIKAGKVYYKGEESHSTIAKRIIEMVGAGKTVKSMMLFMNDLHKNPNPVAIKEFYGWLEKNDLPLTDNGGFLCYKSVNKDNTDKFTGKIDNSPGQIIMTSRKYVDVNYHNQCSTGFHLCSKHYGAYGDKVMAVLTFPRYVLSAEGGKIRVTWYEVLKELGSSRGDFSYRGFADLEKKIVVEIGKEKGEMIKLLLACPEIKRNIRKKKLKVSTLRKYSSTKLKSMIQKRGLVPLEIGPRDNRFLESARKAHGFSIGQIAKKLGQSYKTVALLEKKADPPQEKVDDYTAALADLAKINLSCGAVTYPKAAVA